MVKILDKLFTGSRWSKCSYVNIFVLQILRVSLELKGPSLTTGSSQNEQKNSLAHTVTLTRQETWAHVHIHLHEFWSLQARNNGMIYSKQRFIVKRPQKCQALLRYDMLTRFACAFFRVTIIGNGINLSVRLSTMSSCHAGDGLVCLEHITLKQPQRGHRSSNASFTHVKSFH